ncbi:PRELI domain-containing protein 1, mitochondrial-like isoform X2 [Simochromis diagramma]|uniref:PRELI domain-containing protein 1, mitochondrial-like isoform X2 n=1 Tax=Simochromis diagramma TaxID=43689 RepID=UPI001A7EACE8|nr:PRELI domain-containing protein 1, mitochondrial-like isoform X2 [Simochromis diagramma]
MVKYFCSSTDIRSTWDHVVSAFWQRYPNPFSTHVLTEDVVYREVTADHRLLSRRLLMKTNRLPRWAERLFPAGMSRSVYVIEDSIVDPVNKSLTTYTWNLNHTTLMSVEERCVFQGSVEHPATTQLKREAWISSSIYGFSKPIQEFGLARFKSNQVKAMKGLEYALSNLQENEKEKMSSELQFCLVGAIGSDRKATVTQIVTHYNQRRHRTFFECTATEDHSRCNLSAKNRKLRLQFTQAHQNWTIEFDVNNTMYPLGHFIPTV